MKTLTDRLTSMATRDPNLTSQAAYARSRKSRGLPGGSKEAVRNAVNEGRISAFGPEKLLYPALADKQWEDNTRARLSPQARATSTPAAPGALGQALVSQAAAAKDPRAGMAQPEERLASVDPTYAALRARREKAEAEIAEMNSGKLRGTLVDRDGITRGVFEMFRQLRDRLMTCAYRLGADVATLNSAEACTDAIAREHRLVLQEAADSSRAMLGTAPTEVA
jgi:hypothetical protein